MAEIVNISIDLNKLNKAKEVQGKNGARYYNLSLVINDEANQYGKNVQVTEPQSKEERLAKEKKTFVGSGNSVWRNGETIRFDKQNNYNNDDLDSPF